MGGEVFISPSSSGGGGDANSRSKRNSSSSVTLAVFLSAVLFTLVVFFVDHCEAQQLHAEHRGDPDGGIPLGDYEDDDGGVVPILNHRNGLQHEDVLTALPNHYFVPNAQFPAAPVYQPNGTIGSASSTSATPEAGTTAAASGKDGKDFTPPNDIVRGFKPVYPDDARFVSITTSTVGPPPKRRKKVKRVKGQQAQQQPQPQGHPPTPYQQQQHPQQGFQNSFGFQPAGPNGYYQGNYHGGGGGPYFASANQFYSFTAGNAIDSQNNASHSGHVAFPNETNSANSGSQSPPSYSTLYSTNPSQQQGQEQYQQQQAGPYLSSGVPLTGAPGYPPQQFGQHGPPHGPPLGPPKVNPLKKLANLIRGRPRPPHPGHPPLPPQGPPFQGVPPYQQGPYPTNQNPNQQGPPQYAGGPQGYPPGQGQGQQRHPPYNPALMQQQHYYQQQIQHQQQQIQQQQHQIQQQQQQQSQSQQGQTQQHPQAQQNQQNQTQSQNSNSTSTQATAASNNAPSVAYPGNLQGYPGAPGPHGPPRPGGPPNKNFLSKLNFNSYLKKFSNMFQRGPPPPGTPPGLGVPPGGKAPGAAGPPHGPPPQQKVPQQILYPHYYPLNSYAPNGPNAQVQAQYQQQLQQQQQQAGTPPGGNQIRRRRIKVRKNGMDPRNRKVDDTPEAADQKELIGRPRLAGQSDDTIVDDDMDMSQGMNEPTLPEQDENAGGRRRKRLATISSIATSSSSSSTTSTSSSSSSDPAAIVNSGYRMPGIFGMDSGKAFYLDKDPQTGDITFNAPPAPASGESSAQATAGSTSPSSNELSPDSKYKPIIIHSYSSTKNQGGLSTYKRPNLASLNNKFKAKRPTFYKFNKTSTLAPPRLPSFYVPSTTQFPSTSSTTVGPTVSAILPGSEEGSTSAKPEFPNVIVATSSSEVITRVSMSSSVTSSKEVVGPQYKKKSPVKFPLFKHTTPSTTTSTASTTTEGNKEITTTEELTTTSTTTTQAPPEVETTPTTTVTTTTTTEPTSTSLFYDPYLPFELLNLQKQAMATSSTTTSTTTTPAPPTTTEEITTVSTTTTTEASTVSSTTPDPYTVPEVVKVETTTTEQATSASPSPSSSAIPSVAPSDATNGSSLLPTGPDAEQIDQSQEQDEDEDYYYDNPEPGQGYGMAPVAGGAPGQFNSFGQYRPGGGMPPHGMPGGYFNPMMGGGQSRPPVVPPHPNNYYNSFNPFGPPGYYPPGHPNAPQNIHGGGLYNPTEFVPSSGIPVNTEVSTTPEITTTAPSTSSTPSSTTSSTTSASTTTSTTTTTTEPPPTTTVSTTPSTEPTTQSTTVEITTTTSTTPLPPPQQEEGLLGEPDVYEEYEDELEGDTAVLPSQTPPQHPNSFHLPPPPPRRPQPPIPPHRRPPPPPPFMNRIPPAYFNNQRPPPVRQGGGNFPFRPPPPVKEVMKSVTTTTEVPTTSTTVVTTISTTTPTTTTTTTPTTTTTTTTTTQAPTTTTTLPPTTTTTTTTTTPRPPPREEHIPSESREAVNQDLFIPPEQLLAYTPSPDRVQEHLPDEVIQDIAPGFDLFNVQWGQKVPPPSSTSYSSQEQQPVPVQHLTTTQAPPTTRIISRNVTEVNINGTDYIYEYIDEIIEEEVPVNATEVASSAVPPSDAPIPQQPQAPAVGVPPQQQLYNPYIMNPYNGFVVSSTPGYGAQGPFMLPNGQPAWIQPQQGSYDYYLPPGVSPNQFPAQGLDGSQQFIPVGAGYNPSSIAPPQELSPAAAASSPASPSPTPEVSTASEPVVGSSEIMTASPSSVHPPLAPITENSVDNVVSPSAASQNVQQQSDDLSESYIVSLIDPNKQNGTAVSPLGGLGGFISSTSESIPSYQNGADTVEHTNLLISSTSGTPAPVEQVHHISSSTTLPPAPSTTTTEKAVSYEYVDYPEGDDVPVLPGVGPQGTNSADNQQQLQNIQALQMMRPPAPLPPHLQHQQQQQQQQQQGPQGLPPHGPPHPQKKKPSSFLQNLFGKLRPGSAPPGGPPPPHHGHLPYPQGMGPQMNKNGYIGDSITAGSGPIGVSAPGGQGMSLLPPVMIPSSENQEQFNMDTLFGARNGTVAEDPAPASTQATTTSTTSSTTTTSPQPASAELGSDEEDEVIYVTPEELAKLKETGQVDDFELVEDEEEYEYEDEPLNDIANNKLARSDTKFGAQLGQNETIDQSNSLLKKTAPIAPITEATTPSTTVTTTTTSPPSTQQPPSTPSLEVQERKQELLPPQPYSHSQPLGVHPQPAAAPFPPSQGIFQMKPPDFGRPPQGPPHAQVGQHHPHAPPQPPPHHHHHHQGRVPVPPPPPPYRTIPQSAMNQFHHRQSAPSASVGGTHYNANIGNVGAPPSHFYNPLASSPPASSAINVPSVPSPIPITNTAEKRKDSFQANYDYDESIELITAGPMLDPNIPRDIIVKSSFNTANGGGPKPKSMPSGQASVSPSSSPAASPSSGGLSGLWQGAVEKVSAFMGEGSSSSGGSSYLQKQSSHPSFSNFGRALPNHFDKNAHLRQLQAHAAAAAAEQPSRGMRHMHGSSSSDSTPKISSSRKYWGPGI